MRQSVRQSLQASACLVAGRFLLRLGLGLELGLRLNPRRRAAGECGISYWSMPETPASGLMLSLSNYGGGMKPPGIPTDSILPFQNLKFITCFETFACEARYMGIPQISGLRP